MHSLGVLRAPAALRGATPLGAAAEQQAGDFWGPEGGNFNPGVECVTTRLKRGGTTGEGLRDLIVVMEGCFEPQNKDPAKKGRT